MKYRNLSLIALTVILFTPQVILAATWWKPSTWFANEVAMQKVLPSSTTTQPVLPPEQKTNITTSTDTKALQTRIDSLLKQNNDLLTKLNTCTAQNTAKTNPTSSTIIDSRDEKLKDVDGQILPLLEATINRGGNVDCDVLLQKIKGSNWSSNSLINQQYKQQCTVSTQTIADVNKLLESYRVIDTKMTHKNIIQATEIQELRDYLTNIYIKYR